jgi:Tautomerase enzyme
MPLVKLTVSSGVYDQSRLDKISNAIHSTLLDILKVPQNDYFVVISEMEKGHFYHPDTFLGHTYTKEFMVLEITFGAGRPVETHEVILKELNKRIASAAGVQPDDMFVLLYDINTPRIRQSN